MRLSVNGTGMAETKKNKSENFTKPLQYDTLMNKFPMYHIIIRILTCPILWIPVPNYGFSYENQNGRRHCTIDAITNGRRQLRWI